MLRHDEQVYPESYLQWQPGQEERLLLRPDAGLVNHTPHVNPPPPEFIPTPREVIDFRPVLLPRILAPFQVRAFPLPILPRTKLLVFVHCG
jgi:hypothetical protein